MEWKYNEEDFIEVPKDMEGFVYLITNLTNKKSMQVKNTFGLGKKIEKLEEEKRKKVIGEIIMVLATN